ncbi:hypothetical protein Micbo1qcDRAFT_218553 [Microdochium bolleyi]|uniref:MARVEL domain-containing protein n=1 Tax=Microdochium bolleyi TaxID=196109 RepID=A0A136IPG3_9PEZI|nr:hypothetical protein Micbo1qcDRAFT_218553 [Microdochium bolleyi]
MSTATTYPNIWRKRHNLTAWILQLLASLAMAGLSVFLIVASTIDRYVFRPRMLTGVSLLVYALVTIALVIVEIVKFSRGRLSPVLLIATATTKTVLWGVYVLQSIISAAVGGVDFIMFPITIVLMATAISQLAIADKFHRKGVAESGLGHEGGHKASV